MITSFDFPSKMSILLKSLNNHEKKFSEDYFELTFEHYFN